MKRLSRDSWLAIGLLVILVLVTIVAAVSPCVKPKTIGALRSYWRKQKAKYAKELPKLDCNNDYMKKEINKAVRQFDQLVSEVRDNCRRCIFC